MPPSKEQDRSLQLTKASSIYMELITPRSDVRSLVTTFFRMRCDDPLIRDVQPSSIGIFAVMARGSGTIHFLNGRAECSHPLTLITPTSAAATFVVNGPWEVFGAMLSPIGWAGLTGMSAATAGNRLHDARDMLPRSLVDAGEEILLNFRDLTNDQLSETLSDALIASAKPLPAKHVRFIQTLSEWLAQSLSPQLLDLLSRTEYSSRQVQRLTERYFGMTPQAVARKYRALRAAVLLSRADATHDDVMAVQDHFYDQSHMIREMRLFAGRTPARIADPNTPYLASFLSLRDFQEATGRIAPIPSNLRA